MSFRLEIIYWENTHSQRAVCRLKFGERERGGLLREANNTNVRLLSRCLSHRSNVPLTTYSIMQYYTAERDK